MIDGYRRVNAEAWRRTRFLIYNVACMMGEQSKSIFEFFPLYGDPTKQEQEEIKSMYRNSEEREALEAIEQYRSMKNANPKDN